MAVRLKQRRAETDGDTAAPLTVFAPLPIMVAMPAETEEIEIEGAGETVSFEHVVQARAEMPREEIRALTNLPNDTARDRQRILEFCGVGLMEVAEAPQPLPLQDAAQACLARVM